MADKKAKKTSYIVSIVMLVLAFILIVAGFVQNSPCIYRENFGCYHSLMVTYSSANGQLGFSLIMLGGFLLVGGILVMILSVVLPQDCGCCCDEKKESGEERSESNPNDDSRYY